MAPRPLLPRERAPRGSGRLLSTSLMVLVALLVPTLVVFSFMRSLPDTRAHFTTHNARGASGASRAAARSGPHLGQPLFGDKGVDASVLAAAGEQRDAAAGRGRSGGGELSG